MSTTSSSPFMREAVRLLASAPMRSLARRICPRDYEDVLQDAALACVKLERRHPDFTPRNTTALLSMIVRHEAIDRINAGKRKRDQAQIDPALAHEASGAFPGAAFEGGEGESVSTIAAAIQTPESAAIEREAEAVRERQRNFVRLAVAKLPPERREQIVATHWDETPARRRPDTSKPKVRGQHPLLPFGTAVSRVSRANEQLRAMPEIAEARRLRVG